MICADADMAKSFWKEWRAVTAHDEATAASSSVHVVNALWALDTVSDYADKPLDGPAYSLGK